MSPIAGIEKAISKQIMSQDVNSIDVQTLEDLIAGALKHHHTHGTKRRVAMHVHLRLKNGATEVPMNRHELVDLAEMVATDDAINDIMKRLATFYVRIAQLRARIISTAEISSTDETITNINIHSIRNIEHLQTAYATNERNIHEKRNENQRELNRIMRALFLDSDIHPNLTEDDLSALEMQVDHIAGRGCTTQELRRLKIMEAALAQQKYDAIIAELNALDDMIEYI
jgi:hypothetical protein